MTNAIQTRFVFHCYGCGADYDGADLKRCAACGEPVAIKSTATPDISMFHEAPRSLWHYAEMLPITSPDAVVSIGEGATPLVDAPRLAGKYGFAQLLIKNEAANPTGSFKDRQVSVGISRARELGYDTVSVVSSGNVACATAAYAARAGMRAVLMMHGHAAGTKLKQAAAYGAVTLSVQTPSAAAVFDLCRAACEKNGWYHLSTAGMYEPFNVEGAKTIAYEIYFQTGGVLPDWLVAPVGGGGLLGGIWRGFLDLQRLGLIKQPPRLLGVQATGCAPFVVAIEQGQTFLETLKTPWPNPKTIAGGIADDIIFDGHTVLPAIRETGGRAVAVDDDAIIAGELELAQTEGLLCEPTCAVVAAALAHVPKEGNPRVCCIMTGTGIKDLDAIAGDVRSPIQTGATLAAIDAALAS